MNWNSNMLSNVTQPLPATPSGNGVHVHRMNAAQALFNYKHTPAHRGMSPIYYAPSTPAPYPAPLSPALSISPSPTSPSPSPLASQPPVTADAPVMDVPGPMPKARNAFIIFRSHFISSGQAKGVRLQNDISRLAADTWNAMNAEEKEEWKEKAAEEKKERNDRAKAIEMGYGASHFVNMSARPAVTSKKAQRKKDKAKAAAIASALKKDNDSARKAEKRKADSKIPSSPSPLPVPAQSSIHLPQLVNGPLVRPESSKPAIVPPSSRTNALSPFIADPYTNQSHTYDSPLDSEQRTISPSPVDFHRVAGTIQVVEPSTRTFLAPSLPSLGEFQESIENPWLGNRNMFVGAQRVPVQTPVRDISLSRVLRESALAKRQAQFVWPQQVAQQQGEMSMSCINPQMLGTNNAMSSSQAINPSTPASFFMAQSPSSSASSSTTPLATPFETLSSPVSGMSQSDFPSPSTPQYGSPSPASHLYTFSRTPSPFAMPNLPAPDTYLYTGFEANSGAVPLSKTSIANKQHQTFSTHTPQPQVAINSPQTDINSEWANFGTDNVGDWQWLAAQMSLPGVGAGGLLPDANINSMGEQAFSNTNMMGAQAL
ncbi:hypothetical protein SCHPADRAFT_926817 [Schizopora paradoxa]|uniref:HMG box domain-containing protein n=1 Tax=Schizopora paradoxa TaxID=27342 RepID=A0A0H2RVJ6_9AGAM|nr:hypothetical protein SCHPADRAFT_926817 [Schizopora paradoxa]